MSNRQVVYQILLDTKARQQLIDIENSAKSLDSTMAGLKSTAAAFGLAFGAGELLHIGKEWLQGAADYEQAMLRIKNVSESTAEGFKNQFFITNEVDKFKIDLQKATDGYGDFLTMVRGSGLAASEVRKLHDEVLMIGKITGIGDGQMDAAVRNMGKLLEEGALEGRHLRPLTYQLSGLMPYISKEMGMSNKELEKLISSGNLTKSNVDSHILLDAVEKYANDLAPKLGESLNTLQSKLNDTDNAWLRFKNNVGDSKEFRSALDGVNQLTHFLEANAGTVFEVGKRTLELIAIYQAYKAIMGTVGIVQKLFGVNATADTLKIYQQTNATNQMVAAIERLNFVLNANTSSFIANAEGIMVANTAANRYILSANSAPAAANSMGAASRVGGAGAGIAGALSSGLLLVGIAWMATEVMQSFGAFGKRNDGSDKSFLDWFGGNKWAKSDEGLLARSKGQLFGGMGNYVDDENGQLSLRSKADILKWERLQQGMKGYGDLNPEFDANGNLIPFSKSHPNTNFWEVGGKNLFNSLTNRGDIDPNSGSKGDYEQYMKSGGGILDKYGMGAKPSSGAHSMSAAEKSRLKALTLPKSSSVRGNSVTNVTLNIHDIIGLNNPTFPIKNLDDWAQMEKKIGATVAKVLTDAVNDSQHIANK